MLAFENDGSLSEVWVHINPFKIPIIDRSNKLFLVLFICVCVFFLYVLLVVSFWQQTQISYFIHLSYIRTLRCFNLDIYNWTNKESRFQCNHLICNATYHEHIVVKTYHCFEIHMHIHSNSLNTEQNALSTVCNKLYYERIRSLNTFIIRIYLTQLLKPH